jgi:RNA polymerase sigma factor (sigma-70 family)
MFKLETYPRYRIPSETDHGAAGRIASVMPMVTRIASRWLGRLPERHRRTIDLEDALQEVCLHLFSVDHRFDPARGRYTTFATVVTRRLLHGIGYRNPGVRLETLETDVYEDADNSVLETVIGLEDAQEARQAVREAMRELTDHEHFVMAATYGVNHQKLSPDVQAAWLVTSRSRVIGLRTSAENRMRKHLAAI